MNILILENTFILDQLKIEEALLRNSDESWVILNTGSQPAIVMGISHKMHDVVYPHAIESIPIIKRFSGGGNVIVDENTLFLSLLFNKKDLAIKPFPEPMYRYVLPILQEIFQLPIELIETDYIINGKKCIGNAQSITKDAFLHHMSILYDFDSQKMGYLRMPEKAPKYRNQRKHTDFLCSLKEHGFKRESFILNTLDYFASKYSLKIRSFSEISSLLETPHRTSTQLLNVPSIKV
ncbi:MAG: Lipoate-protein ligase LplJ [Chlamydiae bacterium]|nr:Lipoate-protein ligase LplJ [Chlamydiota bacterium]